MRDKMCVIHRFDNDRERTTIRVRDSGWRHGRRGCSHSASVSDAFP